MSWFWLLAVVVMWLLFWGIYRWQRGKRSAKVAPVRGDELPIWPFEAMPLMTDSEVIFFRKLQQALPEYYISTQVQLSRLIEPSEAAGSDRSFWFNRICRQSVDYVVVDSDAQTTLVAIELDDWTHASTQREKQDAKKDKALASAGIPIMRFHAERLPSVEMLRHEVLEVLLSVEESVEEVAR